MLKKKQLKRWFAMPKLTVMIVSFMVLTLLLIAFLNQRLTPTYLEYAEVQTTKIASMVISKAINARIANVVDVNEIIEHVPGNQDSMVTTVEQKIPVAMGSIQGQVPQIYNSSEGSGLSVEVPLSPPSK